MRFFDGDQAEAFLAGVKANTTHGMPLSLADRQAAVDRIIRSHPRLSDRSIAEITGISAKTVAGVRRRITPDRDQDATRIGKDGRVRPLSSADARRAASEMMIRRPEASLREVARSVGLSPATVRDVRERMRWGDKPVSQPRRTDPVIPPQTLGWAEPRRPSLLHHLNRDPSLRFRESGREVLRWLRARATGTEGWDRIIGGIPSHSGYLVAELARCCAKEWAALAQRLEEQARSTDQAAAGEAV